MNEGKHALQTQHKQEIERLRGVLTNENSEYQENFMAAKKRNEEAEVCTYYYFLIIII